MLLYLRKESEFLGVMWEQSNNYALAAKPSADETEEQARDKLEQINTQLEEALTRANDLAAAWAIENNARAALLSALPSILISVDEEGYVQEWNARAESTFGLMKQDTLGKSFLELPFTWDWPTIHQGMAHIREREGSFRLDDVRYTRPNGKLGFLGLTLTPLRLEGYTLGFLILGADITERKSLESQLVQAQKMESIGQLAAGIAHEINTPIQYVGDNTQFIQKSFAKLQAAFEVYEGLAAAVREGSLSAAQVAEAAAQIKQAKLP